jgi:hypothetical protein
MDLFKRVRRSDGAPHGQPASRLPSGWPEDGPPPAAGSWPPPPDSGGHPASASPGHRRPGPVTVGGPTERAAIADVLGSTMVPQIVVGVPSPVVEPVAPGPDYRAVPYRPDLVVDGWSIPALTMRGASQRGHLHRYNGAPRQDDFAVHHLPDGRVVVVVADGVSAAKQSHIGSSTAVRQAAEWLCANLVDTAAVQLDWTALIRSTSWALTERAQALLGLPEPDPVGAEQLLATTLVCAVIEPAGPAARRAYLIGVGDSSAWLLSEGSFIGVLGGKADSAGGVSSSAVAGLPRVPADLAPMLVEFAAGDVLLIGTDGIGDPLGGGDGGVGNLLRTLLTGSAPPSLVEFAHAVDFSRETFDDDRTLVAIWPRRAPPPPVSPARPEPPSGLRSLP